METLFQRNLYNIYVLENKKHLTKLNIFLHYHKSFENEIAYIMIFYTSLDIIYRRWNNYSYRNIFISNQRYFSDVYY